MVHFVRALTCSDAEPNWVFNSQKTERYTEFFKGVMLGRRRGPVDKGVKSVKKHCGRSVLKIHRRHKIKDRQHLTETAPAFFCFGLRVSECAAQCAESVRSARDEYSVF